MSIQGDFIYCHHNELRVQLFAPKEETFPIPLKYIDVTGSTHSDLDVLQEKRIDDCWNMDVSRRLSDCWRSFWSSRKPTKKRAGKVGICVWNQPCPVSSRTTSAQNPAAKTPTLTDLNMHVSSTLTSLRDSVRKELCQKIMQIALQGRGSICWVITFLCTSSLLCLKQCKTRMSEPLWTKSEESSKNCHHGK